MSFSISSFIICPRRAAIARVVDTWSARGAGSALCVSESPAYGLALCLLCLFVQLRRVGCTVLCLFIFTPVASVCESEEGAPSISGVACVCACARECAAGAAAAGATREAPVHCEAPRGCHARASYVRNS